MAKTSSIEKNNRRRRMAEQQAPKRKRLKAIANDLTKKPEERFAARVKLAEMPRKGINRGILKHFHDGHRGLECFADPRMHLGE